MRREPAERGGPASGPLILYITLHLLAFAAQLASRNTTTRVYLQQLSVLVALSVVYRLLGTTNPGYVTLSDSTATLERGAGFLCKRCNLRLPLRAKHCKEINACVRRFDHFCPWLGVPIAERNHCLFLVFVALQCFLCALMLGPLAQSIHGSLAFALSAPSVFGRENVLQLLALLIDALSLSLLLPLLAFHTYLALANFTTWEVLSAHNVSYLKDIPSNVNPFSQGLIGNLRHFCIELPFAREPVVYSLPPTERMKENANQESIWDNRYYSCFN